MFQEFSYIGLKKRRYCLHLYSQGKWGLEDLSKVFVDLTGAQAYALCSLPFLGQLIGDPPCWRMGRLGSDFWDGRVRVIAATGTGVRRRSGYKDVTVQYASSIVLALFLDSFGFLSFFTCSSSKYPNQLLPL